MEIQIPKIDIIHIDDTNEEYKPPPRKKRLLVKSNTFEYERVELASPFSLRNKRFYSCPILFKVEQSELNSKKTLNIKSASILLKVPNKNSGQSQTSLCNINTPIGSAFDLSDTNSILINEDDKDQSNEKDQHDHMDFSIQQLNKLKLLHLDEQSVANNFKLKYLKTPFLIRSMSTASTISEYKYETLMVTSPSEYVFHVEFNRPDKRNAMSTAFFNDVKDCFNKLKNDYNCRSILISGKGKLFTAGLDLTELSNIVMSGSNDEDDVGRRGFKIKNTIESFQDSLSSIENCPKPVIACIHSACVGGGVDLISACDIRYCTNDAWFSVKEVDIGLAADIGTLQRLPKIIGNDSLVRELVYTARKFDSEEAKQMGLISRVFNDHVSLLNGGIELAKMIASKSPIAVQGSKINLIYSRDHSVQEGLKYMTAWNMSNLQSEDLAKSAMAHMTKEQAIYSKL